LIENRHKKPEKTHLFGAFKGVFIPSILTIFGVIMYLRLGWVVGYAGIWGTILIVTMSTIITLITTFSISATATNMRIRGGGAYYMISRSLGLEAGAAVGIPLFLAQALGISFYIAGFAEVIHDLFPDFSVVFTSVFLLAVLFVTVYISANVALKTQYFVALVILLSLVSFFMGNTTEPPIISPNTSSVHEESFWKIFAVFFPAVTGIEAGLSLSGNLKDPSRALPIGTLVAVVLGYVIYLAIPIVLYYRVDSVILRSHPFVMRDVAFVGEIITLGVLGASLSSALGGLLGAPRTLQALARDRIMPPLFGKGFGKADLPRVATVVTFIIALLGVFLGDLNTIAPILSMFFLTSYGVLNFSAGIEGMIGNPSWRPKFSTPWSLSFFGAFMCFAAMFMINAGATLIALTFIIGVYYLIQRKHLAIRWGDMRRGILMQLTKFSIGKLAELPNNTRSWRPHILVLSGSPTTRWYLIELAYAMTHKRGIMTTATILPQNSHQVNRIQEIETSIKKYMVKRGIPSLVRVTVDKDSLSGAQSLVRAYGLGPLIPNTIVLGETEKEDNFYIFAEMLIRIYQAKRNIVIVRESKQESFMMHENSVPLLSDIDIWWGRERQNAGLSLALGFMIQKSRIWKNISLHLKSIVKTEDNRQSAQKILEDYLAESRINADCHSYVEQGEKSVVFSRILNESRNAQLIFLGMKPPNLKDFLENPEKTILEYRDYYCSILKMTQNFPMTVIVLAAEDIDFHKIFTDESS